jgi:hypothetical protein
MTEAAITSKAGSPYAWHSEKITAFSIYLTKM